MKRKGPKPGTKPAHSQNRTKPTADENRAQFVARRTNKRGGKPAPNLEGIDQPWYAALKAAWHATPEQVAEADAFLSKRASYDEVRR